MIKYIKNKFLIILTVITALLIIYGMIAENVWVKQMLKNPRYTIGEATSDWHQKNNNGVGTDYRYQVNDKIYFKTGSCSYRKGDRFLIIFDSIEPQNARVLDIYAIENYLIGLQVPKNGWKYQDVPFDIDSNTIKKYLQDWNVEPFEYIQK
ncbi:hypothetical protein [Chryseobacterium sp.]|uniref:hypothetical protein n=1 Tax=Chryseobacterium sp. TaxID=1871047 RepID=UPI0025BAF943|nr:hypothetical protein [Chryseobacterium sp.]MBV8325688.1 hypothetical protein [Chryseobacterium sp.]